MSGFTIANIFLSLLFGAFVLHPITKKYGLLVGVLSLLCWAFLIEAASRSLR